MLHNPHERGSALGERRRGQGPLPPRIYSGLGEGSETTGKAAPTAILETIRRKMRAMGTNAAVVRLHEGISKEKSDGDGDPPPQGGVNQIDQRIHQYRPHAMSRLCLHQ